MNPPLSAVVNLSSSIAVLLRRVTYDVTYLCLEHRRTDCVILLACFELGGGSIKTSVSSVGWV